ncbi:ankyrin repeat domain-containing protein [Candidatus Dependentiae bacterium]|nr:ankyrin repeat domain-containing protein [Candidatus Dependentiae bacterium]
MNLRLLLSLFICQFFLVQTAGNSPTRIKSGELSPVKEILQFLDNDEDAKLAESIESLDEDEKNQFLSSSYSHLIGTHENWVLQIYESKGENLPALLGYCASLCSETLEENTLREIYKSLKVFFENLNERPEAQKHFEDIDEEKFIKEPEKHLIQFLCQYSFEFNKNFKCDAVKLQNMISSFAHFINEDETNLFDRSVNIFDVFCQNSKLFGSNYKKIYLNKIFFGEIVYNFKLFKKLNNLNRIFLEFLIRLGADVNHCDHSTSNLTCAVKQNYVDLAKFLITHGADVNFNFKCSHIGCETKPLIYHVDSVEMLKLLLQNNVKYDVTNADGDSAIFFLLGKIYFLNILEAENETELRLNMQKYIEMIKILLNKNREVDCSLLKKAQNMLNYLDSVASYNSEFKKIVLKEFSLKALSDLIYQYK